MDKKFLTDVHHYWFGDLKSPTDGPAPEKTKIWFGAPVEVDNEIREKFAGYLDEAKAAEWDLAGLTRPEQMALVILFDQFPRHIFRTTGQQFAYDSKAKAIAGALIDGGVARFYGPERLFLTLPFQHSENLSDQDYSVWLLAAEVVGAPEAAKGNMRNAFEFAYKHWDIIRKFGRFPHRNVFLGRESTPEELEFLKGGRGF